MKLFKSEFLKLVYQRRTYGLLLAAIAINILSTAFTPYVLTKSKIGIDFALSSPAAVDAVYAKSLSGYLFVVIVGVFLMSSEFAHHTAIATFLATPKRSKALVAKLAMAVLFGAVFNLIATCVGLLSGAIALNAYNVKVQPDAYIWVDYPAAAALTGAVLAAIGVAIGALIRNQNLAVSVTMIWLFLIDRLVTFIFPDWGKWLPTGLITSLSDLHIKLGGKTSPISIDTSNYLSPWPAAGMLVVYGAVFSVAALLTTMRRDID